MLGKTLEPPGNLPSLQCFVLHGELRQMNTLKRQSPRGLSTTERFHISLGSIVKMRSSALALSSWRCKVQFIHKSAKIVEK